MPNAATQAFGLGTFGATRQTCAIRLSIARVCWLGIKVGPSNLCIARRYEMARDQERTSQRGGTKETNSGNFANDREKASRAGHKGGKVSGGNFANDRERAAEAGRKGGQNSHGGGRRS